MGAQASRLRPAQAKCFGSLPLFVWHALNDSDGRAKPVGETGRNFRIVALDFQEQTRRVFDDILDRFEERDRFSTVDDSVVVC